jgi:hypothetical protein
MPFDPSKTLTLRLVFETAQDKSVVVSIPYPRIDITKAEVIILMDDFIEIDPFEGYDFTGKIGAELISREKTDMLA